MTELDQWHEIHDAYVTFFGDEHRPAAVRCADRGDQRHSEIDWRPGAIWPVASPGQIQILQDTAGRNLILSARREAEMAMFYGVNRERPADPRVNV